MNILLRDYTYAYIQIHTACSTVLIEKSTGSQIVTNSPTFMEPEGSLKHS